MVQDIKKWKMAFNTIGLIIVLLIKSVLTMMYTRCYSSNTDFYKHEPLYTSTCETVLEAALRCSNNPSCDLISINGTRCSFHMAAKRAVTCANEMTSNGTVSKAKFTPCNCTLIQDFWMDVGPFYLYVTPDTYTCSQGQDVCMSHGGIMAEFYSIDERNYAMTYVAEDVYVGGHLGNGTYIWRTTEQEVNASLWSPGEPTTLSSYSCVQIWFGRKGLDDIKATSSRPVLCQKRMQ